MTLHVSNLSFSYGKVRALNDVTFEFPDKSNIALVGANGAGKSTLMALISGVLRTSQGHISFNQRPHSEFAQTRRLVSHLPQDAYLPNGVSIRKSLTHFGRLLGLGSQAATNRADELLELVGLEEASTRNDRELSHGMRKRASLAQALIQRPSLLILDEPTAGLDPVNAHNVREIIKGIQNETTLLISSHNLGELEDLCEHLVILDQGKVRFRGAMSEATQQQSEVTFELSFVPDGLTTSLSDLGYSVEVNKRRLILSRGSVASPENTTMRKVFTTILATDAEIVSFQRGSSLEASLIDALRRHPELPNPSHQD